MGRGLAERETVLRWDDEERVVHVYSGNPAIWRRCERLGMAPVKRDRLEGGTERGRFYRVALAEFRWGWKGKRRATGNAGALAAARAARKAGLSSPALPKSASSTAPSVAPGS
jgi:hypothetical protein